MGYDAGYFGYLWSEAYAADLFSEFEAKRPNVMDPSLGRKYRDTILAPCATVDGDAMLQNFLGREASLDPFLKRMGVL
jgi:thimet oligopeptidase